MLISSETIWTTDREGELIIRTGKISPLTDQIHQFDDEPPRVMHVQGLKALDFAVFMTVHIPQQGSESVGYLVSAVDSQTQEGIVVLGDSVEAEPRTWLNERLIGMIALLGEQQMAEFNLQNLHGFVARQLTE